MDANTEGNGDPAGIAKLLLREAIALRCHCEEQRDGAISGIPAYAGTRSYDTSGAPARVDACSIVIEQMFPSASTSSKVFSSKSRVSLAVPGLNSM